jgi:hypothetical protein
VDETRVLTAAEREARRRRLDEVFGDVLPEQTSDDTEPQTQPAGAEEWLRRQVPPHHG